MITWTLPILLVTSIFILLQYHLSENRRDPSKDVKKDFVKIAFFGDQGLTDASEKVLQMISEWGADAVVHMGDFDYEDSPASFEKLLEENLPSSVPVFAALGNHDIEEVAEYQYVLASRLRTTQAIQSCRGVVGYQMACDYKSIKIITSAVGTIGNQSDHEDFLRKTLHEYDEDDAWKICVWHKTQKAFQIGEKQDDTGYEVYDICRRYGAIIFNGHKHAYSRTAVMSRFETKEIKSKGANVTRIGKGHTFSIVSGTGGHDITAWSEDRIQDPWWDFYAASNNDLQFGAVLCKFRTKPDGSIESIKHLRAKCKYKDIDGKTWDKFDIEQRSNRF